MNKKLAAVLGILFLTAVATGTSHENSGKDLNLTEEELQQLKKTYNNNTEEIPKVAENLIGGQNVNLEIGNQSYLMELEGLEMERLQKGELEDPTLEVEADRETVKDITESESPREELKQELQDGGVNYRTYGLVNRIKFSLLEMVI